MSVPATVAPAVALTHFAGRAGDHSDLAMVGSRELAAALRTRLGVDPVAVGSPEPALSVANAGTESPRVDDRAFCSLRRRVRRR